MESLRTGPNWHLPKLRDCLIRWKSKADHPTNRFAAIIIKKSLMFVSTKGESKEKERFGLSYVFQGYPEGSPGKTTQCFSGARHI